MPKTPEPSNSEAVGHKKQPLAPGFVEVRVTKFGAGKVSTGEHVSVTGDVMAKQGDVLAVSEKTAKALEARGLVEVQ